MQLSHIMGNPEQTLRDDHSKTLAEAIYKRLRRDILSGRLRPGSKLRFADLKANHEAGTSTLREALSRLSADRLVVAGAAMIGHTAEHDVLI
jgi:DNA-binding GntR family transcriptional regulator